MVVGMEGAGGDGRAAVGRDHPQLIGLVELQRLEVAGQKHQAALRRVVGDARDGRGLGLRLLRERDADGSGIGERVEQLAGGSGSHVEPMDLRGLGGDAFVQRLVVSVEAVGGRTPRWRRFAEDRSAAPEGGDRGRGLRRCDGLGKGDGNDLLLPRHLLQQAFACRGGRLFELRGQGAGGEVAVDAGEFGAALHAAVEMVGDGRGLIRCQELHCVEDEVFGVGMVAGAAGAGKLEWLIGAHDWNAFLSVSRALRMRVFTVPSGSPVISAISECVRPSKKAISRVLRCSVGRSLMTPRACSIRKLRSASSARL